MNRNLKVMRATTSGMFLSSCEWTAHFVRLFLCTILISSPVWAGTAKVLPAEGVGATTALLQAYFELIKMALKQSQYEVVGAEQSSPDLTLSPSMTQLGQGYILVLQKKTSLGETYEDSFKIASEDELDLGTKRLVKAVLAGKSAAKLATVDDVSATEVTQGVARQETVNRIHLAFGPTVAYGFGTAATLYNFETSYSWERDHLAPRVFGEINWGPAIREAFSFTAGMGLDYYLTHGKEAPFIGADLGIGGFHRSSTMGTIRDGNPMYKNGFSFGVNAGYAIMRNADTSMFGQFFYRPVMGGFGNKSAGMFGMQIGLMY